MHSLRGKIGEFGLAGTVMRGGLMQEARAGARSCYRSRLPMLTSAITAVITGVLSFFGIPPGPYIAGVWIGVKIVIVSIIGFIAWRTAVKARRAAAAAAPKA